MGQTGKFLRLQLHHAADQATYNNYRRLSLAETMWSGRGALQQNSNASCDEAREGAKWSSHYPRVHHQKKSTFPPPATPTNQWAAESWYFSHEPRRSSIGRCGATGGCCSWPMPPECKLSRLSTSLALSAALTNIPLCGLGQLYQPPRHSAVLTASLSHR